MEPFLSILVPTHLCNAYTRKLLSSLADQKLDEVELVFNINNMDANQATALRADIDMTLSNTPAFIKVFDGIANHANALRFETLAASSGRYAMFLDCDDYLTNNSIIAQLIDSLKGRDIDVLSFNMIRSYGPERNFEQVGGAIYRFKSNGSIEIKEEDRKQLLFSYGTSIVCKVFKRALLTKDDFIHVPFYQDWNISGRLFLRSHSFMFVNAVGYAWVIREDSASHYFTDSQEKLSVAQNSLWDFILFFNSSKATSYSFLLRRMIYFAISYHDRCRRINAMPVFVVFFNRWLQVFNKYLRYVYKLDHKSLILLVLLYFHYLKIRFSKNIIKTA